MSGKPSGIVEAALAQFEMCLPFRLHIHPDEADVLKRFAGARLKAAVRPYADPAGATAAVHRERLRLEHLAGVIDRLVGERMVFNRSEMVEMLVQVAGEMSE